MKTEYYLKQYGQKKPYVPQKINYRNTIDVMLKKFGNMSVDLIRRYLQAAADKDNEHSQSNTQVEVKANAVIASMTTLCSYGKCRLEGDVLIYNTKKDINANIMDCLWVALDYFKVQSGEKYFAQDDLFIPEEPCALCKVTENGPISFIEVDETSIPLLIMLQNNYLMIDKKMSDKSISLGGYIIVVRYEDTVQKIRELNLCMPYKIALLKTGETRFGTPKSIRYFD